jgi:hypothetical protein
MVIIERTKAKTIYEHGIVCHFVLSIMTMVLSVIMFFLLWPWYCLFFFSFYYDNGIVCPFVLSIMTKVLSLLLFFLLWPWYCLSFCPFYYDHGIVCPFVLFIMTMILSVDKRTDNTMVIIERTEGETIPWS